MQAVSAWCITCALRIPPERWQEALVLTHVALTVAVALLELGCSL